MSDITRHTIFICMLFASVANLCAQSQQELTPLEKKQLTVLDEPATLYKGFFRAILAANYTRLDKFVDDNGDRYYGGNAVGYTYANNLILAYGINDRLTLRISLPYLYHSFKGTFQIESIILNASERVTFDQTGGGLGDIGLAAAYQLVTETPTRPSFRGTLNITFPTGEENPTNVIDQNSYKTPVGDGRYKLELELQVRKILYPYTFSAYLFYQYKFDGEKIPMPGFDPVSFENSYLAGTQVGAGMHLNDWLTSHLIVEYQQTETITYSMMGDPGVVVKGVFFTPDITFQIQRFRLYQSTSILLLGRNTSNNPSYLLGFAYTF